MNTVLPLNAARACAWSLHDHLLITGAPLLDLTDDDGGANNDEAGPSGGGGDDEDGSGGGYTVKEEDYDVFNYR